MQHQLLLQRQRNACARRPEEALCRLLEQASTETTTEQPFPLPSPISSMLACVPDTAAGKVSTSVRPKFNQLKSPTPEPANAAAVLYELDAVTSAESDEG